MSPRGHPTPVAVRAALAEAIDAATAADGVDAGPLHDAAAVLAAPWRVAVVGRTSAGKSSLVGQLTGAARPVGLGGVTDEVAEVPADDTVVIDTPGIDDPNAAVVTLGPVLERVDAVVWVVDGLQPMTASERDVLRDVLAPDTLLAVVVSKLDLVDPEEHEPVLGRVREIVARTGSGATVGAADLRRGPPERIAAAARVVGPVWPAPRRVRAVRDAVRRVREALAAAPAPLDPDTFEAELRDRVRDSVRRIDERIVAGGIDDAHDAENALRREIEGWLAGVSRRGGPRLGPPEVSPRTRLAQVKHELAGAEGARRALKAAAARWLQEAQWVVHDGWAGAAAARAASQARTRLNRTLDRLELAAW